MAITKRKKISQNLKKRFYLFIFRERGREEEGERNISVWLPLVRPLLGTWPATQACALTGNRKPEFFRLLLPSQPPLVSRPKGGLCPGLCSLDTGGLAGPFRSRPVP